MGNGSLTKLYGSNVFGDVAMRERLPKAVYKAFKQAQETGAPLDPALADVIANAMKDWATEKGATHFCHWFQPMTGSTAEKHDSFISPTQDGRILMEFSGKELVQGEPDASSFPSGGMRATFEARGYTIWDYTSPAFVKPEGDRLALHIPSAFCSYTGDTLDKKTPLLRSMDALNKQALRVLRTLGNTSSKAVRATLGAEQEYFLIDQRFFEKRLDLVLTGRTLFGAPSPRGQEMEDHYFGTLHERVASFMHELNQELWKLGVSAKTQHNEVAPAQYELAPIFATVNVASDWNQLTMETLCRVGRKHRFVCLLHEKPFAGVNGSGKHNNWSMATDDGINLLEPGKTPHDNMVFMVMCCAVLRAVDKYADLLRASVATPGNDHRLGANEAPPAIVSVFLGDQLTDILGQLEKGGAKASKQGGELRLGASTLPPIPKDTTDRNRTSPFAFTGNKFEFRMVGSSQSTSGPMFVLNTIVADILCEIADELEKAKNVPAAAQAILSRIAKEHKRIVYNGDNYTEEWVAEARKRGLPNHRNTVDALNTIMNKDYINLFKKHSILSKHELHARYEILMEIYVKTIRYEALTMINIARRQILPAAVAYSGTLAGSVSALKAAGMADSTQARMLEELCGALAALQDNVNKLDTALPKAYGANGIEKKGEAMRDLVVPLMVETRQAADKLEMLVDARVWPLPTYAEMLYMR